MWADEAGMDARDKYDYGYNPQGERYYDKKPGRRQGRANMIVTLCGKQIIAPFTVKGSCNRSVFELWLETCLIPVLRSSQVLIIDNTTFPKGGRIQDLVERAECRILYLPPYSPNLNRIEKRWSWIKSRIRKQRETFETLREAMEYVLRRVS